MIGDCSSTCGAGTRQKRRRCEAQSGHPGLCTGNNNEEEACKLGDCGKIFLSTNRIPFSSF